MDCIIFALRSMKQIAFFFLSLSFITITGRLPPSLTAPDPQSSRHKTVCGPANATVPALFFAGLNSTFPDLRSALSSSLHASAQVRSFEPVFSFFQCRDYLTSADCLACFDAAAPTLIRSCYPSKSGFLVSDGCTLGYRSSSRSFDGATNSPGVPVSSCEEDEAAEYLGSEVAAVAGELVRAVPKGRRRFAAAMVGEEGEDGPVYAVGQCLVTESVGASGCRSCLQAAYENVKGCLPAVGGWSANMECFLRYSCRPFFNQSQVVVLVIDGNKKNQRRKLIVGLSAGAAVATFCLILAILIMFIRRSRKRATVIIDTRRLIELGLAELREPVSYEYNDLRHATENFSDKNKLGQGGFAVVYKGVLKNGRVVAVKKLTVGELKDQTGRVGFDTEIVLLSNTRHRNLVSLLGYCRKGPELMLVYEYMENGSLDKIMFGGRSIILDWRQRFDVIVGVARGLTYLHEDFYVPIIHRDIKCGNILLDDQLHAKIGDFGLARLFPEGRSHVQTILAGTRGYTAPEYMMLGQLSEKADTYSFGVIVLEIISGRRCSDRSIEPYLLEWAWRLYETNSLLELADESLKLSESEVEDVKRVVQVGLMCTQSSQLRPAMSEVVARLLSKEFVRFELFRSTSIEMADIRTRNNDNFVAVVPDVNSSNATISMSHFSAR